MADLPQPEHTAVQAIYRLYEQREAAGGGHRPHLGASVIGHACERHLWLLFHWCWREAFGGRMLRLFNTGQRAEARFVDELRGIGCEVHDVEADGQQFRVSAHGGHFGGSMDAALCGLPEAPKAWHVGEFKTHNDKSFKELGTKGVQAAKPMHFKQMQVYMGLTGMDRALYLAENKNTSELYAERVHFDVVEFERLMARAERVITAAEPPPRISADPAWFECKWCAFHPLCHAQQVPEVNCRTCAHSTPKMEGDGRWVCELNNQNLPITIQRTGCGGHRFIPILLERLGTQSGTTAEPSGNATVHFKTAEGGTFSNGLPPAFSSTEIAAAKHKSMLTDSMVQDVKQTWATAKVVA